MVMFCPMNRRPPKDTLLNVKATREFVANIVSEEIAQQMNLTSGDYASEINEFDISGLTPVRERHRQAPARTGIAGEYGMHRPPHD